MRAANISPVPEKKQSIAGIEMLKMRGEVEEVEVEPTTERWGGTPGVGMETEVIIMWGIRYLEWSIVIASFSVSISTILTPESVLFRVNYTISPQQKEKYTYSASN